MSVYHWILITGGRWIEASLCIYNYERAALQNGDKQNSAGKEERQAGMPDSCDSYRLEVRWHLNTICLMQTGDFIIRLFAPREVSELFGRFLRRDACKRKDEGENWMTSLDIYCISNQVVRYGVRKGSGETGNKMKNVKTGGTVWLITTQRHATPTMPGVTSDTLLTHISLQFLHDDSLRAAVSGPAVPSCCQSGSHGTSSN